MLSIADQLRAAVSPTTQPPASPAPGGSPAATAPASALATLPTGPQALPRPCQCGFRTFWLDPYGTLRCQACTPPKFAFQIKSTHSVEGETPENYSWQQFSEAQEKIISELVELQTACGRNVIARTGWDDLRSENFNQRLCLAVTLGLDEADRILDQNSRYLSGVLQDTGTIDTLPGPWPRNKGSESFELAGGSAASGEKSKATRKLSSRGRKK